MTESIFKIRTPGIDAEQVVREIRESVEKKMEAGTYADARVARAERTNVVGLRQDEQFLEFYLQCLRDAVFVDISDFEISERRRGLAPLLVTLKKVIWKLLKFYTYRLWSQQNQVNGLLVTSIQALDERYKEKIRLLEERVAELEEKS